MTSNTSTQVVLLLISLHVCIVADEGEPPPILTPDVTTTSSPGFNIHLKNAVQSSTLWYKWGAERAIDGNMETSSVTRLNHEYVPWWSAELSKTATLHKIVIHFTPMEFGGYKQLNVSTKIGDLDQWRLCSSEEDIVVDRITPTRHELRCDTTTPVNLINITVHHQYNGRLAKFDLRITEVLAYGNPVHGCWKHLSPGCLKGYTLTSHTSRTVDECKNLCVQTPHCKAFEYAIAHGGVYRAGDCRLKSSKDRGCDGRDYNVDLYVRCERGEGVGSKSVALILFMIAVALCVALFFILYRNRTIEETDDGIGGVPGGGPGGGAHNSNPFRLYEEVDFSEGHEAPHFRSGPSTSSNPSFTGPAYFKSQYSRDPHPSVFREGIVNSTAIDGTRKDEEFSSR